MTDKVKARLSFIINITFFAVVAAIVYISFQYIMSWVLPFLLAFCIVSILNPLVRVIRKNLPIKKEIVSLIVMILIYAILAVLLILIIMQLSVLVRIGLTGLPGYFEQTIQPALIRSGDRLTDFVHNLPPEWENQFETVQDQVLQTMYQFLKNFSQVGIAALSSMAGSIPSFLIGFAFTIMLSFFISMQYDKVLEFIMLQLPARAKTVIRELRGIILVTVVKYFKAAITLMAITFVELSIGLFAIRTENAILIAAGIAVFDALPFLGTGAIMVPWCAIELLQGNYRYAFGLAILYGIVTVIRNLIEPKIVGDQLGLNPIVSLVAIYLGFKLFGVLGMIVMPILTQIVMELHHKGSIHLFREAKKKPQASAKPKGSS